MIETNELEKIEQEIEALYKHRDEEIKATRSVPRVIRIIVDRKVEYIKQESQEKIDPLERRRKYILEKIVPTSGIIAKNIVNSGNIITGGDKSVNVKIDSLGGNVKSFSNNHPWLFTVITGVILLAIGYIFKLVIGF